MSTMRVLEDLKCAATAAQAHAASSLDTARRRAEAAAGVPAGQRGRGVGAEVALARRESPHQGSRLLGLARLLTTDMPHTLAALESGALNEWRATLIARETICLSTENRQAVDAELAADTGALEGVGTQGLKNRARRIAYRLEPGAVVARARRAVGERHVSCRPAPDTMAYLTALLPAGEAISAYSALSRHADTRIGTGEGRGRGQLMADTLVECLTGSAPGTVRAEVQLIMTDRTPGRDGWRTRSSTSSSTPQADPPRGAGTQRPGSRYDRRVSRLFTVRSRSQRSLTARTLQGAESRIVCAVEPMMSLPTGVRCRSPITISSASSSSAVSTTSSAAVASEMLWRIE